MMIAGDVAIAHSDRISFRGFEENIRNLPWCINLEGAVLSPPSDVVWGTYNTKDFLRSFTDFNVESLFLANNHIHDVPNGIAETRCLALQTGLSSFGAGQTIEEAARPATIISKGRKYVLLGFGWSVIGCCSVNRGRPGTNPLVGGVVRQQVVEAINRCSEACIVVVIHGNYEFECYPQPAHRKLARELIDAGAYAVIFHHSHIVGPIECYNGRTIAYSLGNWAFSYGRFFAGRLRFPKISFHQIAIELNDAGDIVHHAQFLPPSTVSYLASEPVGCRTLSLRASFEGFSDGEYVAWFKEHRLKRKMLPIYRDADVSLANSVRDGWVWGRQQLVDMAAKTGLKLMRSDAA